MLISTFHAFALEIALVIILSLATGRKNTYSNIAFNGILSVMAGGTLLYDNRIVGLYLLAYGTFLMTAGVKEYEEERITKIHGFLGKFVRIIGHYLMVGVVLLSILAVEYLGINVLAYLSVALSFLIGLVILL